MSLANTCLKVRHDGKAKVVGKIALVDGKDIFYHAHKSNQRHRELDALAIDVSVVEWLTIHNIDSVHYYDMEKEALRIASTQDFLGLKAVRKGWGNRDRYYLPLKFWNLTKRWYPEPPWAPVEVIVGE